MPKYYDTSNITNHTRISQHADILASYPAGLSDLTDAELATLTDGSDASGLHIHDSRYYTETELSSVVDGSEGSTLIGYKDGITVKHILDDVVNKGVLDVITVADVGTLDITWTVGQIYDHANGDVVETDSGSGTCTDGAINYLKWVSGSTLTLSTTPASGDEIRIAHINCQDNDIWTTHEQDILSHRGSDVSEALGEIFETIITSGLIVSEDTDVTNVWDVVLSAGVYFHEGHERHDIAAPVYSRVSNLTRWYHTGGVWDSTSNAEIDKTQWDTGTNLTGVDSAKYYRSLFFIVNDGDIHWVYPSAQYVNLNQALMAADPTLPPGLEDAAKSVVVILKGNDAAFPSSGSDRWIDIRPVIGAGVNATLITDHRNLTNLVTGDSGHTQFLMVDGSKDLTSNWTIATNNIILTAGTLTAAGMTLTGTLALGANKATTTYVPLNNEDLVNKAYADSVVITDHRNLTNLTTGDSGHTQFLMVDGSKDLTSSWTIATNNITLTAGTLTTSTLVTTYGIYCNDTRSVNSAPDAFDNIARFDFKLRTSMTSGSGSTPPSPSGTWGPMLTMAPWNDGTGEHAYQLYFLTGGIAYRHSGMSNDDWSHAEWQTICESEHSFTMNTGTYIAADIFQARDASGVKLLEDGGKGLSIADSTGIATFTAPLVIEGPVSDGVLGPILKFQFAGDPHKVMEIRPYSHDDISITLDAYFNIGAGQWQSSDAGSNFLIQKMNNALVLKVRTGVAPGSAIAWSDGVTFGAAASLITTMFHSKTITNGPAHFGGDTDFYLDKLGGNPRLQMSNDAFMLYDRTDEFFAFYATGGSPTMQLEAAGVLTLNLATATLRFDSATTTGGNNGTGKINFTVGGVTRAISFDS